MTTNSRVLGACTLIVVTCTATSGKADVAEITEKEDWIAAVEVFSTIDFTDLPDGTFITDQYADLDVLFTDGDDNIACCDDSVFLNDGAGLDGNAAVHLSFLQPQQWLAAEFPGAIQFELYFHGELTHTSKPYGTQLGMFVGLVSDEPFDAAVIYRPAGGVNMSIDDLHFGVPAPSAIWLLGLGALSSARGRR